MKSGGGQDPYLVGVACGTYGSVCRVAGVEVARGALEEELLLYVPVARKIQVSSEERVIVRVAAQRIRRNRARHRRVGNG